MPTDSELKAAAERVRRVESGERGKFVYGFDDEEMDDFMYRMLENAMTGDLILLAKAYLAQRADDGEEVDADFLVEVGMRPMASHQGAFETPDGVVIFNPWEYGWVVCNGLPKINTRGQLRQLLSALGIQSGGDAG